jgi:hypothetical protein
MMQNNIEGTCAPAIDQPTGSSPGGTPFQNEWSQLFATATQGPEEWWNPFDPDVEELRLPRE